MLELRDVHKSFVGPQGPFQVLGGIDLSVDDHAIVSFVGRSGCGKSTLLRIIAGLEVADRGGARLDGEPMSGPRPEIGVVFQEPRLMPWLTVRQNVRLGLSGIRVDRPTADARIDETLRAVGLLRGVVPGEGASMDFDRALPKTLSGGMAQRVAIARALVRRPSVLLLDEPFSAVDAFTRAQLQDHLLSLWSKARFSAVFVTHDIEEAIYLSDRIILLEGRPGRLALDVRVDAPRPRRRSDPYFTELRARLTQALAENSAGRPAGGETTGASGQSAVFSRRQS